MRRATGLLVLALAGCGSADSLPPAEGPSQRTESVRLDTRARTLTVGDETVNAGAGPSSFTESPERVYVIDRVQNALLVFAKQPEVRLERRTHLPARPESVSLFGALDREPEVVVLLDSGETLQFSAAGVERRTPPPRPRTTQR